MTDIEWRQLRPWNLTAVLHAARCHPSKWPHWAIVMITFIRPPLLANTAPGVIVNFTRPLSRPVSVLLSALYFLMCATAPAMAAIALGWWAAIVVLAALAVAALRLNVPTLGSFQGPATMLLLHDFTAATRGTGVPEAALEQLLVGYDEPIKLTVNASRHGLVRMYRRLGFVPSLDTGGGDMLLMIRPAPLD